MSQYGEVQANKFEHGLGCMVRFKWIYLNISLRVPVWWMGTRAGVGGSHVQRSVD